MIKTEASRNSSKSETVSAVSDVIDRKKESRIGTSSSVLFVNVSKYMAEIDPGYRTVYMTCIAFLICNMDKVSVFDF